VRLAAIRDAERNVNLFFDALDRKELSGLRAVAEAAEADLMAELERIAQEGTDAPWPLGTKMFKGVQSHRHGPITTVYGIVEAITRTSIHPKTGPFKAQVGQFVVRYLNADDSVAKRYDTSFRDWKPIDSTVERNEKFFAPKVILV
jgi:hypothetical protein